MHDAGLVLSSAVHVLHHMSPCTQLQDILTCITRICLLNAFQNQGMGASHSPGKRA
jgi:hypothetical protein